MNKFEKNDRVKYITNEKDSILTVGDIYTVKETYHEDTYVELEGYENLRFSVSNFEPAPYQLDYKKTELKDGTVSYSAFSCTCSDSDEISYKNELVRIFNLEWKKQFSTFDDIIAHFGIHLTDALFGLIDSCNYSISDIVIDQWCGASFKGYEKDSPSIWIEYDVFIYAVVDFYHIHKIIQADKKVNA